MNFGCLKNADIILYGLAEQSNNVAIALRQLTRGKTHKNLLETRLSLIKAFPEKEK